MKFQFLEKPLDENKNPVGSRLSCVLLCFSTRSSSTFENIVVCVSYFGFVGHPDYDPRTIYVPQSSWLLFTPFEVC